MQATVIYSNNPFHPFRDRDVVDIKRKRRISSLAPKRSEPLICLVNGKPLLRENKGWNRTVKNGEIVAFIVLPQGGGGGGSNPIKMILAISISIYAPYAVGSMFPSMVAAGGGLTALGTAVAVGVAFAGNALLNVLIRDPMPSLSNRSIQSLQAASPTYNISAQGNQARIGQSIPVLYGRNMVYMDFAAQPYTEYAGNEQYLFQLFVIGQGEYDIEQIRLEDTVIENEVIADGEIYDASGSFEEIQYQICYNQDITLFPANVVSSVEVSGQESKSENASYSKSGTTITVTKTNHGLQVDEPTYLNIFDGFFNVATVADADTFTVESATSSTASGGVVVAEVIGDFIINDPETEATQLAFDVVLPRGLYYANDIGGLNTVSVSFSAQYQEIDDFGVAIGAWTTGLTQTITLATTTPQRFTYRVGVPTGRFKIRFARTNLKQTDTRYGNDVNLGGVRAYLKGSQNFSNITMLAMRMKASNQLNQTSSKRINTICTRMLPIWDGLTWSNPTVTRNPAWAIADIATASYGMGLAYNKIDANQLLALSSVWDSRVDNFDAIYDGQQPAWEAMTQMARVGRAKPYIQQGNIYVTRDSKQETPVAMFTMRNINKGSFNLSYLMPSDETSDAVDVEYWDNGTFQKKVVRCALNDSASENVTERQLFGCSSRDQAYREGMYMVASNRYRRRLVSFSTEMEGYIPSVGDLIVVQHDMPQWGLSGEVVDYDPTTLTVTLSEPVNEGAGDVLLEDLSRLTLEDGGSVRRDFEAIGTYYIAFRTRAGNATQQYEVTLTDDPYQVILSEIPSITPDFGLDRERTHFAFGVADSLYIEAKVLEVKPRTLEKVEISCVVDSDFVYNADTGATPSENAWQLPNRITRPVLLGLLARSDPADVNRMFLSWQPSAGAERYLIEMSDNGNGWTRVGETSTSNFTTTAQYGSRTSIRVAPVGAVRGGWVTIDYGSSADYMWAVDDANLMWAVDDTTLMWI